MNVYPKHLFLIEIFECTFKSFIKPKNNYQPMKTIITFCTNHGCTEKVAQQIKDFIGDASMHNLKSKERNNFV